MKLLHSLAVVVLLGISSLVYAQHDMQKTDAPKSEAQKSFDQLKTLAGSWQGSMVIDPPSKEFDGKTVQLTLRATSMGNALMHEMKVSGRPDDPITMLYLDGDRLLLTHYCDAGNRPRMVARTSPDGRTVDFDFLDVAGSTAYGHMDHAKFTVIDANHHSEEWTYMQPGDKPAKVHFDLQRVQ
ncbi:MAG TPA: hypothetical protein VJQ82_19130 [Terriglobales bacterium]|nr:hypothetical protein [Terriglobales bacterium]